MSVTPRISLLAYESRDMAFIFVAIPDQRGRYVRTDRSVAFVGCTQCGAVTGEPCKGRHGDGYGGTTHVARRAAYSSKHWGKKGDDVLAVEPLPPPVPDEWMGDSA